MNTAEKLPEPEPKQEPVSEYIAWSLLTGVPDSELETIKEKQP
jgi:hypothetical protein